MKEYIKQYLTQIDKILDQAADKLNEMDYIELCDNVESSCDARSMAMREQIKMEDEASDEPV